MKEQHEPQASAPEDPVPRVRPAGQREPAEWTEPAGVAGRTGQAGPDDRAPVAYAGPPHPPPAEGALARGITRVTGSALAPYQTAVVRIGFAATWLFFLLREWPHRHELYGPDSPWSWELADRLIDSNHAFTVLLWSDSDRLVRVRLRAAPWPSASRCWSGWRTRTSSVLFMIGVLALQNRSVFMGDGGDNVIHLMSMYLVLTRCGQVWSLDARRERRRGRSPRREERDAVGRRCCGASRARRWSAPR